MQPSKMANLPVLYFRNPLYNGFLEKYHLHCFINFVSKVALYLRDVYEIKFSKKNHNILISQPCCAFPAPQFMTTTRFIWKLIIFTTRWIWQTKFLLCVCGGVCHYMLKPADISDQLHLATNIFVTISRKMSWMTKCTFSYHVLNLLWKERHFSTIFKFLAI